MKIVHRLIGYLQWDFRILLCLGACIEIALRYQFRIDPLSSLSMNWLAALCVIPIPLVLISVSIFYMPEKYNEYIKPTWGGRGLAIPQPDRYFYSTMVQDIGAKRKFAGYIYAISKIIFFLTLGAQFFLFVSRYFS